MHAVGLSGHERARCLALAATILAVVGHPIAARPLSSGATALERLAGSWSGSGTAGPAGSAPLRVTCQADFNPSSATGMHMALRCAGGGYAIEVDGDLSRDGDRVGGTLMDREFGVSGRLAGTVGGDRMRAVVSGMGRSALLSMTIRGDVQAVTLQGLGDLSASASVVLHRA